MMEKHTLIPGEGGVDLEAAVTPSAANTDYAAVVCHPWGRLGGCMDDHVVMSLRDALVQEGFTVCRFNFRGVGGSTGGASFTASGEKSDVNTVCRYLAAGSPMQGANTAPPASKIVLVGYSYGSMVACSCIEDAEVVVGACAVSYPFDYTWALALWGAGGMWKGFRESHKPKLMVCGDRDNFCSASRFKREAGTLKPPSDHQVYEGIDHFWVPARERRLMVQRVAQWAVGVVRAAI
mmetsp:Transcript_21483/g.53990  ORF Transcript_21483/g.53990 Transcript_21483/m.53990 type:complete len:236 (-) Transcript_21483:63-770(-)|eukprot:CAMPEP_0173439436 /NCGR_PEP_ID=MMETSP1357-20121228/20954_1 /TAXON_ID=77926 /ORGANISM="Hemiselmis rufescens, Strain PCC563" /LENGTH=235 /DNA_ID=CAMNT_0014404807 /DNA_START=51 /DNA_END=758 /DNA_ORIENTATION=+